MTVYDMYRIINASILKVIDDTVPLMPAPEEEKQSQFRLKEIPYEIGEVYERVSPAITAHKLIQYSNRFYSIRVKEADTCWLDYLIDLNREDIDMSEFGGAL